MKMLYVATIFDTCTYDMISFMCMRLSFLGMFLLTDKWTFFHVQNNSKTELELYCWFAVSCLQFTKNHIVGVENFYFMDITQAIEHFILVLTKID